MGFTWSIPKRAGRRGVLQPHGARPIRDSDTLSDPSGTTIPDYTLGRTIYEVKAGLMTNSSRLRKQANQDKLLLDTGVVGAVEWHFYPGRYGSLVAGPSLGLVYNLLSKGFRVVLHFPRMNCRCPRGPFAR